MQLVLQALSDAIPAKDLVYGVMFNKVTENEMKDLTEKEDTFGKLLAILNKNLLVPCSYVHFEPRHTDAADEKNKILALSIKLKSWFCEVPIIELDGPKVKDVDPTTFEKIVMDQLKHLHELEGSVGKVTEELRSNAGMYADMQEKNETRAQEHRRDLEAMIETNKKNNKEVATDVAQEYQALLDEANRQRTAAEKWAEDLEQKALEQEQRPASSCNGYAQQPAPSSLSSPSSVCASCGGLGMTYADREGMFANLDCRGDFDILKCGQCQGSSDFVECSHDPTKEYLGINKSGTRDKHFIENIFIVGRLSKFLL